MGSTTKQDDAFGREFLERIIEWECLTLFAARVRALKNNPAIVPGEEP
jgi:hypothetical protein